MLKLEKTLLSRNPGPYSYSVSGAVLLVSLAMSLAYWLGRGAASGVWADLSAGKHQVFVDHEFWRLFTALGVHADLKHFLSNSIFFWIFGFLLNGYFGGWVFPVLSLVVGALVNALTLAMYPENSAILGASGMVYFMAAMWATMYYLIERGEKHVKRILGVVGVSLVLFFPTSFEPNVSYLAHAWGFAMGILSALIYFKFKHDEIHSHEKWRNPEPFILLTDEYEWLPEQPKVESEPELNSVDHVDQPICGQCSR